MRTFHRLKKEVGLAVLAKYNNKCTTCDSNNNLCIHHIVPMKPENPSYNDLNNLTVLCRSCHMRHHRKMGDVKPKTEGLKPPSRKGKKKVPVICSEEGCGRPQHARGFCNKHYEHKRRNNIITVGSSTLPSKTKNKLRKWK